QILDYMKECEDELERLVNSEAYIKKTKERIKAQNNELFKLANKISDIRKQYATILQDKITSELKDLEMRDSNFTVDLEFLDNANEEGIYQFKNNGLDRVEFFISTNKGEKEKPLSKIASGGEMSRIMLAIKSIISDKDNVESLIFDEIDTGISGRAAQRVGEKLARLSKTHQLICITHLSQIATMADNHYMIEKSSNNNKTKTDVKKLSNDEMEREVARIIGGVDISDITIKNASEMLRRAREWKTRIN
ncbi:MAG: DNA repair protein RecN, partial [Lachnospiraceae bacterium]|nr:DNA repair protein RecN [Lachnospiraceae bacterium]